MSRVRTNYIFINYHDYGHGMYCPMYLCMHVYMWYATSRWTQCMTHFLSLMTNFADNVITDDHYSGYSLTYRNPNSLIACPSHSKLSECTLGLFCSKECFITCVYEDGREMISIKRPLVFLILPATTRASLHALITYFSLQSTQCTYHSRLPWLWNRVIVKQQN